MPAGLRELARQAGRRQRQLRQVLRRQGIRGIELRLRESLAHWIAPKETRLPLYVEDVVAADIARPFIAPVPRIDADTPLRISWVMTPPSPNGGGHNTVFRMIRYLQNRGCANRVYFHDMHLGDHDYYTSIVRECYGFVGPVQSASDGFEDTHALIATAWPTAYPVFNSRCAGARFYFVQDYEPNFHPTGSLSALAENTYRMGLYGITAGAWLPQKLRDDFGMKAEHFEFGCDIQHYTVLETSRRNGVVFYARQDTPRRAFELGVLALQLLHRRRPDLPIHVYGDTVGSLPIPVVDHGRTSPQALNEIYNQCFAGLSLSMTNTSLVPHEMLASGCIPVVNDAAHNRILLANSFVEYAQATPAALAGALERIVADPSFSARSANAAASVRSRSWNDAGATVERIIRNRLTMVAASTAAGMREHN